MTDAAPGTPVTTEPVAQHPDRAVLWSAQLDDAPVDLAVTAGGTGATKGRVAVAGAGGALVILDGQGAALATDQVDGGLLVAAWSPAGDVLALGGPDGAWAWTEPGGLRWLGTTRWCGSVTWGADGRLAVANGRNAAVIDPEELLPGRSADRTAPAWNTPAAASTVTALVWLRDGRELGVGAYGGVVAYARGRDRPARELPYAGSLLAADVNRDGRWLVSGNQDASIHVWRVRDGEELEMAGFPRKVGRVRFDAAGRWLAADGSDDTTVWDFSGRGPGGTAPRLLRAHPRGATAFAWHPDQPVLATGGADGSIGLWDVTAAPVGRATDPDRTRSTPSGAGVAALAWLDDDVLVAAGRDGMVTAFPLQSIPSIKEAVPCPHTAR